jgi:hypothetical protein
LAGAGRVRRGLGDLGADRAGRRPAPVITITQPTATPYTHSSTLTLDYNVTDGPASGLGAGSGVASVKATMDGSTALAGHGLASGQKINLRTELPAGPHTFTIEATDNVPHSGSTSPPPPRTS